MSLWNHASFGKESKERAKISNWAIWPGDCGCVYGTEQLNTAWSSEVKQFCVSHCASKHYWPISAPQHFRIQTIKRLHDERI